MHTHASLAASPSILGSRIASSPRYRQLAACALALAAGACAGDSEPAAGPSGAPTATVTKVSDGDTIRLSGLGRVRLIGIDTPEVFGQAECFGAEASAFVERLLPPGTRVRYRLGTEERDGYGRALAYVWLPDRRFLNRLLVSRGYAQPLTIPPNVEYADRFRGDARAAREAGRGLWAHAGCAVQGR